MAQTNYTPIILYNSGTTTNAPSASNLASGELAINYTDGKLFYKDNSSAIQVIGWKTTPTTAGGTGLTSYTAGDLPYYASGSALSKLAIGTANYVLTSSGTAPQYVAQSTLSVGSATNATNVATTDNTSSSSTYYPTLVSATSGNNGITTSSTKLSFVPSTGVLTTNLGSSTATTQSYGDNSTKIATTAYVYSAANGPTVSAYISGSNQSVTSNTWTLAALNATEYDTNSNFNTSTYKFTPTVAGYYQVSAGVAANNSTALTALFVAVYKNGSVYKIGGVSPSSYISMPCIVYCNGSTDYIQLYGRAIGTGTVFDNGGNTYLQISLIRGS